jgi:quinol monooxygenase YgiN
MLIFKKHKRKRGGVYVYLMGMALVCINCTKTNLQNNDTMKKKPDATQETYQEIGFLGPVKQGKRDSLVAAVQNNITYSRKEAGNLSFSLYQTENEELSPVWFERFITKEAHSLHMQQAYFKNAITVIQQSLAGEAHSIELLELKEVPATIPKLTSMPRDTYRIIALFNVQPENRQSFITIIANAAAKYRVIAGNLEYNMYQYKEDPNKFVLIEGWENKAYYEAEQKRQNIKPGIEGYPVPGLQSRWVVKDISQ